jgi:two-component system, NarL family, sensor histidine kinase DesK
VSDVLVGEVDEQALYSIALFVLPIGVVFDPTRPWVRRYRWVILAIQAGLTAAGIAWFGQHWQFGIDGLLAGLAVAAIGGWVGWALAGSWLIADSLLRTVAVGLPAGPFWLGAVDFPVYFIDDAVTVVGLAWLSQLVRQIAAATRQTARDAVTQERLRAADLLHSRLGSALAVLYAEASAAGRAIGRDPAEARARMARVGTEARHAASRARAIAAPERPPDPAPPEGTPPNQPVIGSAVAWATAGTALLGFSTVAICFTVALHLPTSRLVVVIAGVVVNAGLQIYHLWAVRRGASAPWRWSLPLQAIVVYSFVLPFVWTYNGLLAPFLAGSILLLVPGRQRWVWYAAVVVSASALLVTLPLDARRAFVVGRTAADLMHYGSAIAGIGLLVFGLFALVELAGRLEALRPEAARGAVVRERLRVTRDVHDLLGLGLSAVALKSDLIDRLIERDDPAALVQVGEVQRICAAGLTDLQWISQPGEAQPLGAEVTAAERILASVGIAVCNLVEDDALEAAPGTVITPALREAVTNVLRHSQATTCTIQLAIRDGRLHFRLVNDGVGPGRPQDAEGGAGLANLAGRFTGAGGRLAHRRDGDRFELHGHVPIASAAAATPCGASPFDHHGVAP